MPYDEANRSRGPGRNNREKLALRSATQGNLPTTGALDNEYSWLLSEVASVIS